MEWWLGAHVALIAIGLVASAIELSTEEIPNAVVLIALLLGVAVVARADERTTHVLGMLVALLPMFFFWKRNWVGGGALKLFAAFGLVVGVREVLGLWLCLLSAVGVTALRRRYDPESNEVPSSPVLTVGVLLAVLVVRRMG